MVERQDTVAKPQSQAKTQRGKASKKDEDLVVNQFSQELPDRSVSSDSNHSGANRSRSRVHPLTIEIPQTEADSISVNNVMGASFNDQTISWL